jgi:hypothetical protein
MDEEFVAAAVAVGVLVPVLVELRDDVFDIDDA